MSLNSFKDTKLAGNSSILSSSSSNSHDPLRTPSELCPQMGSTATAVATDHSCPAMGLHPDSRDPHLQNEAPSMLLLPPVTSSNFLSTTLNSMPVASPSISSISQPTTGTTNLMSMTNKPPQNGLCAEDSDDCFPSIHHHCHGNNSSSDGGVIFPVGSQEDTPSEISSEQPGSCGFTLPVEVVCGGKDLTSLAEGADNGNSDNSIQTKQYVYLKNSVSSVSNLPNSYSSETSPVSWARADTFLNGDINLSADSLSPYGTNSVVNPGSLVKVMPVNNPYSTGYLWEQFEKLMPRKHNSVSETLHQYGIGEGKRSSHDMDKSKEDEFWDIIQRKSFCSPNMA